MSRKQDLHDLEDEELEQELQDYYRSQKEHTEDDDYYSGYRDALRPSNVPRHKRRRK